MKIGIILMASGFSSRYGANKLLSLIDKKPMYSYILDCLEAVTEVLRDSMEIHTVVVSQYGDILKAAQDKGMLSVLNTDSHQGITASIKLGLENLASDTAHYGFFVADQPYLKKETVVDFLKAYVSSGKGIGCMVSGERLGNPVMFSSQYYKELYALEGDKGGKQVVSQHLDDLFKYSASGKELFDIDRREDLIKPSRE